MRLLPHIPGYELLQRLAGGPLPAVYAGRDCATDEACAVKELRDDWEDEPTGVKLLQGEARAGLRVRDQRLVRLLDAHVTRPPHFIVKELLSAESLRRTVPDTSRLR